MLGPATSFYDLFDSTRRCFTILRVSICNSILRRHRERIAIPIGYSLYNFFAKGEDHSTSMAAPPDLIDISSSDSENEIEVDLEKKTSEPTRSAPVVQRQLPSWASASTSNPTSYNGLSEKLPLLNRASTSTERLTDLNYLSSSSDKEKTCYLNTFPADVPRTNQVMGHTGDGLDIKNLNGLVGSKYADISDTDVGKLSSQTRTLPPSFHFSASTSKSRGSFENGIGSRIPDSHSKFDQFMGTNIDHKDYVKDHLEEDNDEVVMYESVRSRVLPPSLAHGKPLTNSQPIHISDPTHHSAVEERSSENDERLVFQAALQLEPLV